MNSTQFLKTLNTILELGVRQDALAKRLGVTPFTVYTWKMRREEIGKRTIKQYGKLLTEISRKIENALVSLDKG